MARYRGRELIVRIREMKRLVLLVPLALAACATPETQLRTGLRDAGLSAPISACMAGRMVDRLSLVQLRRLSSLKGLGDTRIGETPVRDYLHTVRALKDGEILAVTTTAAGACAIGL